METQTALNIVDALPIGSVVRIANGYVLEKLSVGWVRGGVTNGYLPNEFWFPLVVIHSELGSAE